MIHESIPFCLFVTKKFISSFVTLLTYSLRQGTKKNVMKLHELLQLFLQEFMSKLLAVKD